MDLEVITFIIIIERLIEHVFGMLIREKVPNGYGGINFGQ
jgi:hypothetical protein